MTRSRNTNACGGEYLSLVASLEYNLTFLLAEYLNVQSHPEEFHSWFYTGSPFRLAQR